MNKCIFTGISTALVTPFLDGKVNYPMMEQLLRYQMDSGIESVVVCGTTGEASTLTDQEKIEIYHRCKNYVGNHCQIIAGTGSNNTAHAIELSVKAQEMGADALLIVTPYYNKATADGLIAHYSAIAHCVDIPIILYNVPSRTGVDIPVSVYKQLSSICNIVGVKEANPDITKISKICAACKQDLNIWSGNDDQIVPAISLGGKGGISVLSNIFPAEAQAMAKAALAGDFETAASMQHELMPLIDLLFCEVNPIPVKAAMRYIGFDCGECRLPLTTLQRENSQKLAAYFI